MSDETVSHLGQVSAIWRTPDVQGWYEVKNYPPPSGKRILFFWTNSLGNGRTSIGFFAKKYGIESTEQELEFDIDWVDEDGEEVAYVKEGWYEEGWETEYWGGPIKNVTHWRNLPNPPEIDKEIDDD